MPFNFIMIGKFCQVSKLKIPEVLGQFATNKCNFASEMRIDRASLCTFISASALGLNH